MAFNLQHPIGVVLLLSLSVLADPAIPVRLHQSGDLALEGESNMGVDLLTNIFQSARGLQVP